MKIDLCRLFGVEEGEEFKIEYKDGIKDALTFKIMQNNLYSRLSKDDMYRLSYMKINNIKRIKNIIKLPKKKQFSQDTLNFFKCIDKKWKYIAKDENNFVAVYEEKPEKKDGYWDFNWEFDWSRLTFFNQSLFDQILWEDDEPIFIDDYVER